MISAALLLMAIGGCPTESRTVDLTAQHKVIRDGELGVQSSVSYNSEDRVLRLRAGAAATARRARIEVRNSRGQFTIVRPETECVREHFQRRRR